MSLHLALITDPAEVARIVAAIEAEGLFALDLEFVSASRYVPELGLVQVAWGSPDDPEVAAVDPLAVDVEPMVHLVASPEVRTVLHAAQGDLALLGDLYGATGAGILDTQIAAAFLGLGDQVGYANLVGEVLGVALDKGMQFTAWRDRPLSHEQVRYALDDARYLLPLWHELEARLVERGRLAWVEEESARLATAVASRTPPQEVWRSLGGRGLAPHQLGALRALAAWREEEALATNKPPSWILKTKALPELARRLPTEVKELAAVSGVGPGTTRRYGRAILEALSRGRAQPVVGEDGPRRLPSEGRKLARSVLDLIRQRCREAEVAPHFVVSRADADALVRWWLNGSGSGEPSLPVLSGWRRELAGRAALDWLASQR